MQISPEWASAAIGALMAAGGFGAWIDRALQRRKAALPIVRWDGRWLTVHNRLSEDITIERVDAASDISLGEYAQDDGGSLVPDSDIYYASPLTLDWLVLAGGRGEIALSLREAGSIRLTISSSLRTLRSKRMLVNVNHKH